MNEERVETGVDKLIGLLQTAEKLSISEVSQKLKIPQETIQLWVDFLVEEHILGVDYRFTKPYIFLNKKSNKDIEVQEQRHTLEHFKEEFFNEARSKEIPEQEIPSLWVNHLNEAIEKQKSFFFQEVKKKKLANPDKLFILYARRLLAV